MAGFEKDAAIAISHIKGRRPPELKAHLEPQAMANFRARASKSTAAQNFALLEQLAAIGCAIGAPFPHDRLTLGLAEFPDAGLLVAWLGCLWSRGRDENEQAVGFFRSVSAKDTIAPATVFEAYHAALTATGAPAEAGTALSRRVAEIGHDSLTAANALDYARCLVRDKRTDDAIRILRSLCDNNTYGTPPAPVRPVTRRAASEELGTLLRLHDGPKAALAAIGHETGQAAMDLAATPRRVRLLFRAEGQDAALAVLRPALSDNPGSAALLTCLAHMPFSDQVIRELLAEIRGSVDLAALHTQAATILLSLSLCVEPQEKAEQMARQIGDGVLLARLLNSGKLAMTSRPITELNSALSIASGQNPDTVAIVFPGLQKRALSLPMPLFDTKFAERGVTALYAHQDPPMLFLKGADGIADDLRGFADHLSNLPQVRDAKRVVVLGASGGGFTALRVALALQADACLVYSPPTIIGRPAPLVPDLRAERLAGAFADLDPTELDIRACWPDNQFLPTELVFGADMPMDQAHAERLADRAGVQLVPATDVRDHNSLLPAFESGEIDAALDRLLNPQGWAKG